MGLVNITSWRRTKFEKPYVLGIIIVIHVHIFGQKMVGFNFVHNKGRGIKLKKNHQFSVHLSPPKRKILKFKI